MACNNWAGGWSRHVLRSLPTWIILCSHELCWPSLNCKPGVHIATMLALHCWYCNYFLWAVVHLPDVWESGRLCCNVEIRTGARWYLWCLGKAGGARGTINKSNVTCWFQLMNSLVLGRLFPFVKARRRRPGRGKGRKKDSFHPVYVSTFHLNEKCSRSSSSLESLAANSKVVSAFKAKGSDCCLSCQLLQLYML